MDIEPDICRLCGGPAQRRFSRIILGRHTIAYFQCTACRSLQTQKPYWLESAYQHNLAELDTGAAQRNLTNLGATAMVARVLGLRNIVDFGGGDGLLCRLLRDYGFNCFSGGQICGSRLCAGFHRAGFRTARSCSGFRSSGAFRGFRPRTSPACFHRSPQRSSSAPSCSTARMKPGGI